MSSPTLLILAAGMGSRYGGLKQMDPMGPNGETVLDYSVFDAIRAGLKRVVFIIRKDFSESFKASVGARFDGKIEVDYAYQSLEDLPDGFTVPAGRTKPWGTSHAIRAARHLVRGPFAVINADDFYGRDAYERAAAFLLQNSPESGMEHYAMVGYDLLKTLSDHGDVNRGICRTDAQGHLTSVEEVVKIQREKDGLIYGEYLDGQRKEVPKDAIVSMNFWAFEASFIDRIEEHFVYFLQEHGQKEKSECYIPTVVDELIRSSRARCSVLPTSSSWFGVTYPEDKPHVVANIKNLITAGEYPSTLSTK
ncbi:MAG: nucleotidyltransferase family protein [Akkermansiaceae bacterium]